ncbi:hypothetical protein BDB01DRAFT_728668 [Pilobolus umbonatus]|nr:hypothetical protein BDB01DRAFT_728668 [Pilobolus umbonatus]
MKEEEKQAIIARFLPCQECQCQGWHPSSGNTCECGHTTYHHIDHGEDIDRRLRVALRLIELLEEKGKINDYSYEDEDIRSLKKNRESSEDRDDYKRYRLNSEEKEGDGDKAVQNTRQEGKYVEEEDPEEKDREDKGHEDLNKEGEGQNKDQEQEDQIPTNRKEYYAMKEEREGQIRVSVVLNDGKRESMILLTGLKNIFQKQLPKMPKEYIARLVYDRNHRSIALIRNPNKVIGGICYRPFEEQEFAEIVFCAIASNEQVKGYGSFIMNHLKDYVSFHTPMKHFLTFADNFAVGYFRKQGYTTDITLDKRKWVGYIKDYEAVTMMQCTIIPRVRYLHVPGILESGWTEEMDQLSNRPRHTPHYTKMLRLVEDMQNYNHAWPFLEPVNMEEVADYYDIVKDPMDLSTLEENVKSECYPTMDDFIKDVQKIFDNCKIYNAEDTEYARCALKLERYFHERLRALNKMTASS